MGDKLRNNKIKNIDKIRLGSCIELLVILDNFYSDFDRIKEFLDTNKNLLNNQNLFTLTNTFEDLKSNTTNFIDIILNDFDKTDNYCKYMERFY